MSPLRLLALTSLVTLVACSSATPKPPATSAAGQSVYASGYPDRVKRDRDRLSNSETNATRLAQDMGGYVAALEAKDWNHVKGAFERADQVGRSSAYAESFAAREQITTFFREEEKPLNNAVAGSAAYAAKQNECKEPGQIGGAAVHGMNKGVEKQLTERGRKGDEAQAYIEAHAEAIGPKSLEKLRDQADAVASYAYLVHVDAELTRQRLVTLVDEGSKVKSTLHDMADDADELAKDAATPEGDRKSATARAAEARAAEARVDGEVAETRKALEQAEQRIQKLRDDYQKAFDALIDAVEAKAKAQPPAAAKS